MGAGGRSQEQVGDRRSRQEQDSKGKKGRSRTQKVPARLIANSGSFQQKRARRLENGLKRFCLNFQVWKNLSHSTVVSSLLPTLAYVVVSTVQDERRRRGTKISTVRTVGTCPVGRLGYVERLLLASRNLDYCSLGYKKYVLRKYHYFHRIKGRLSKPATADDFGNTTSRAD